MANQTVLGFDFGMKRIGIAVGQTITKTATPLETVNAKQGEPDWLVVDKIVEKWHPNALVVGRPTMMDGTQQMITAAAENFMILLKKRYDLPVYAVDERLSSKAARADIFDRGGFKALHKKPIDSVAAQIILQDWLSHQ